MLIISKVLYEFYDYSINGSTNKKYEIVCVELWETQAELIRVLLEEEKRRRREAQSLFLT